MTGFVKWIALLASVGCSDKKNAEREVETPTEPVVSIASTPGHSAPSNTSRNQFLSRGTPTFVLGTAGDDVDDHRIATQVGLLRGLALPDSNQVRDMSIDVSQGPAGWPANPVLYGGEHQNAVIAALGPSLPFRATADTIEIGGKVYEGDGYRAVLVVPARPADDLGPGYPQFLLFAGTGPGGVAEINAGLPGGSPIVIADAFGGLIAGLWKPSPAGIVEADVSIAPGRRINYRREERTLLPTGEGQEGTVSFYFPEMVPKHADEQALIAACMRGMETVVRKLKIAKPVPISVYVYPDEQSKQQLTGVGGHGHAVPAARALHVLHVGGQNVAGMEALVAHEATHVLGYYAWGPAGTALMGEGLAVWVSGGYQGKSLEEWKGSALRAPTVGTMLGTGWSTLAEPDKYPPASVLVDEAMKMVGANGVRRHLLGATFETWPEACEAAGSSSDALEAALAASFAHTRP